MSVVFAFRLVLAVSLAIKKRVFLIGRFLKKKLRLKLSVQKLPVNKGLSKKYAANCGAGAYKLISYDMALNFFGRRGLRQNTMNFCNVFFPFSLGS